MLDYIIVGFGLSGLAFVEQLEKNNKSYVVFEDSSQKSSRVAGGLYNPVILKRFTPAWQAIEQVETAGAFYKNIEKKLNQPLVFELPILRRFNSVEEQNVWFEACDKPILERFLSAELYENTNNALDIPYQYGKVKHTGRIAIKKLLELYLGVIDQKKSLFKESFDYAALSTTPNYVEYKGVKARHVIFTEGFGVQKNPFFKDLPIVGNKGEYIIIESKALKVTEAIKSSVFIIPLGNDIYKVGATYNNHDKSVEVTERAKEELIEKLERFLKVPYQIIDQVAGIRPTVKDRKPILGTHPKFANLHILNGMGSRGILIAPSMAQNLFAYIEKDVPLNKEIDVKRFMT
ncbi:FAD-dependent oxidoreductase [Aquimarina aggregata]|uniref:FAD-dependent oxidoreductase n=1 Tax=Aquimarina aggregata TaxID=1642818 RepID=A0A163D2H4_9FLAO|nr:FAD-dependent oxidoreductase [Aquimarina aggregata]KZS42945.1 FAD-dependent oxidoreductase [Aquimarina aggregata]